MRNLVAHSCEPINSHVLFWILFLVALFISVCVYVVDEWTMRREVCVCVCEDEEQDHSSAYDLI